MSESIFDYPEKRPHRRHGPGGYLQHESFRPWLRDEFMFRCVYCLNRESWGQVTGDFEIDHLLPQSIHPERSLDYENLVYACRRCNATKGNSSIDDPFYELYRRTTHCQDGRIYGSSPQADRIIRILDLNSPAMIRWRQLFVQIVEFAARHDESLYQMLTGLPTNLPDLSRLRPLRNSRPEGISQSWYSRKRECKE